jgi:hypothetical protein
MLQGLSTMTYAAKIVLHSPLADPSLLEQFVEDCLKDGVVLIAVIGRDARAVEDQIDDYIVGDGSDDSRFIVTSSHPDETLQEVLEFATMFDAGADAAVEEVRF